MTIIKKIIASLIVIFVLLPLCILLLTKELNLITLANGLFMIGLVFLMIGAFISIFLSGFFDSFQKNMKRAFHLRKKQVETDYVKTSEIFSNQPIYWLAIGVTLILLSVILTLIN